jgi:hypothetical protein
LNDTTSHFVTRFSEELEGRKCGGEREHTAAFMCEDSDIALSRRAAIAELRQGHKGLVTHVRQQDGVQSERGEEATLGGLGRGAKGALNWHRTAVGDVGKVGENGSATNGTSGIEDGGRCWRHAEHCLRLHDNKFCVMARWGKGHCRVRASGSTDRDFSSSGEADVDESGGMLAQGLMVSSALGS